MAKGNVSKEDLTELVKCSLCLHQFREPRALPCLHTYCLSCLQDYVTAKMNPRTLKCPICQAECVIPAGIGQMCTIVRKCESLCVHVRVCTYVCVRSFV